MKIKEREDITEYKPHSSKLLKKRMVTERA